MTSEKKLTLKRIIIYCILSFVPLTLMTVILNIANGGPIFGGSMLDLPPLVSLFASLGMLFPAIANTLTRIITKEGFKNSYLCLNFKGNLKYYLSSILVPLGYAVIESMAVIFLFAPEMSIGGKINSDNLLLGLAAISQQAATAIMLYIPFFGEEFGWRAYLTPKMTELLPEPLAVFVSGIIWGLWHAPLTASGHNFGLDYPFFPWLGIGFMCIFCASLSAFLTLLTKRTGSVFPACIAHGVNNQAGAGIILTLICSEKFVENIGSVDIITSSLIMFSPAVIVGIISYLILISDYKKSKKNISSKLEQV